MKKCFLLLMAVFLGVLPAYGHTYWIYTDQYAPPAGAEVNISICGGHHFPQSSFAIGDKVLWESAAIVDGNKLTFTTAKEGKSRAGKFQAQKKGGCLVTFTLKRTSDKVPRFEAKAILHVDSPQADPKVYRLNKGLEIVPAHSLSGKKKGDNLEFAVLFDGKPVDAKCSVTPEGKKSLYLNAAKDKGFSFEANQVGAYLLTASYQGRGCSLTFKL
jgi:uncharacterized GH25 family protein